MSGNRSAATGFVPVDPAMLQVDTVVDFDLYIWSESQPEPILYHDRNIRFLEEHRERLAQLGSNTLFTLAGEEHAIARYMEHNLDKIVADPALPTERKADAVYRSSVQLTEDIFAKPDAPENFKRSEGLVTSAVSYIVQGKDAFHHLMSLTSYDYYTYTHSVDVCTMGLALANEVGLGGQADIIDFGIGALFHDVGKTKVDPRILNKRGPLDDAEWMQMKLHPEFGLTVINPSSPFSAASKALILEHHERLDGSGYPAGKKGDQIHEFARVAAIADVFDALTTRRSYKSAADTFQALKIMKAEVGNHFESAYFEAFVRLFGR